MSGPVYDLRQPEERLRLLLDQPNKLRRLAALSVIRIWFGGDEEDRLIDELRAIAAQRVASGG